MMSLKLTITSSNINYHAEPDEGGKCDGQEQLWKSALALLWVSHINNFSSYIVQFELNVD